MFKINFSNNKFLKAIFLSTIIILIPFLEFIKANLYEIDFAIYSQLLLYLISVSTLILILILFLLLFKVKKQLINNVIITVAFTYWIFFKFEYLREKLKFFYKIISLNDEILVYLSSCIVLFVIVKGFVRLMTPTSLVTPVHSPPPKSVLSRLTKELLVKNPSNVPIGIDAPMYPE